MNLDLWPSSYPEVIMKILRKIIEWGLVFSLFSPLLLSKNLLFPFVTTKAFFFYIIIDILLLLALAWLIKNKASLPQSKIFIFFLVFLGVKIILDIFGVSFLNSFWGNYERMMGLYTWLHLLIFLLLLVIFYDSKEKYLRLFDAALVVSALVAIYGLLQKLGVYFWVVIPGDQRVYATLGNAAYLAGYLLIHLGLAVYLFAVKKDQKRRIFYALVFLLDLLIVFFTATRGAILALAAALVFATIYLFFTYRQRLVKLIAGGFLLLSILVVATIFIAKDSKLVKGNLALRRLSEISLNDTTTRSRLLLWRTAVKASITRPLVGYGDNNARLPLDHYFDGGLEEDWFDSSHNQFLDELLANGFVGLIIYLSFFIFLFSILLSYRRRDYALGLSFSTLVLAYCFQNLFLFDNFITLQFFVLVLGFLIVVDNDYSNNNAKIQISLPASLAGVAILIILPVTIYISWRGIFPMRDLVSGSRGLKENAGQSLELLEKTSQNLLFGYDNFTAKVYEDAVKVLADPTGLSTQQVGKLIALAETITKKSLSIYGDYSYFYLYLAKIFQQASRLDSRYLSDSFVLLEKAKAISSHRVDIYFALAQGYYLKGDYLQAEKILFDALELHSREDRVYSNLAEIQFRKDDPEQGIASLKQLEAQGEKITREVLENYARILVVRGEWNGLLKIFLWIDRVAPNEADIYSNIALTYRKIGDNKKALEWENKIKMLNQ